MNPWIILLTGFIAGIFVPVGGLVLWFVLTDKEEDVCACAKPATSEGE